MAAVYQIANLTKIYKGSDNKANDEISLNINEGEFLGYWVRMGRESQHW